MHFRDMAINALLIHERTTSHPLAVKRCSIITRDSVVVPQVGREHMPQNWQATVCIANDPGACVGILRGVINQLLNVLTKCELKVSCMSIEITCSLQE